MRLRPLCPAVLISAVLLPAAAQAPRGGADVIPDTMEARVAACVGCHGEQGRGVENVYFPRLAGKPAGYLYNQLVAFRDGRRHYLPMNYLLAYLPDPYLARMADYFAALNPAFPAARGQGDAKPPQQLVNEGKAIVTGGVPGKKIPACVTCHGSELNGREPGIPGLLGLRADYVSAQLGAWRYGVRTALAPDCMQFVASSLTEREVAAAAAYLASLPVPSNLRPARRDASQRLPLACGSQQMR